MKITKNELKRMINESVERQLSKIDNKNNQHNQINKQNKHNIFESIGFKMASRDSIKTMFNNVFKNEKIKVSYDKLNGGLIVSLLDSEINLYVIRNTIIGINDNLKNITKFSMFWKNYKSIPQLLNGIDNYNFAKNKLMNVNKLINIFLKENKLKYYLSYTDYKNYDNSVLFKIMYRSGISVDGGYIESEYNLSQTGKSLIYNGAVVYDKAKVFDNALVYNQTIISDEAQIYGNAKVFNKCEIYDSCKIFDNAQVYDNSEIYFDAQIYGNAKVYDYSKVQGQSEIYAKSEIINSYIKRSFVINSKIKDSKIFIKIKIINCSINNSIIITDNSIKYYDLTIDNNIDIGSNLNVNTNEYD